MCWVAHQACHLGRVDLDGQRGDGGQELLGGVRLQEGDDGAPDLRVVVQEADQADQRVAGQPGDAGQH